MTAQIFEFDGPRGYRLSGKLDLPTSEPQGWAIFAHCFTCGKDSLAASRLWVTNIECSQQQSRILLY
jgi:uncharacterized protein